MTLMGSFVRSFVFTGDAADAWYDAHSAERQVWYRTVDEEAPRKQTVYWLTRGNVALSSPYAACGNEAALEWLYMRVGLLVTLGPHGRRTEVPEIEEDNEEEDEGEMGVHDGERACRSKWPLQRSVSK